MDGQGSTKGTPITPDKFQAGVYYVQGQTWQVGTRYKLVKILGSGSFSYVCLAHDTETGEHVALKRIANVLYSTENAKRVLREVCILRRLDHPNIIRLRDVFLRPSATGRYVYRRGKLQATSLDLYLSLEYCDQGDLFNMRGQLSEAEVKHIMWQMLGAVRYLHGIGVWHRDIKTANILTTYSKGARQIKIADLGSARSAIDADAPQDADAFDRWRAGARRGAAPAASGVPSASLDLPDSFTNPDRDASGADVLMPRPAGAGSGFQVPLTRVVSTPCYRAPEVVMSRGGYSSSIDMWSVGCVFGELLQRVSYIGKASTPHLQVAPVFAVHGQPETPEEGERYEGGPGNPVTRQELHALFAVIGTPAWACIEGVKSKPWRSYLKRIAGMAPTLMRRFGAAGEPAVDLLARLLSFDPARRCGSEEALAHEYFSSIRALLGLESPAGSEELLMHEATDDEAETSQRTGAAGMDTDDMEAALGPAPTAMDVGTPVDPGAPPTPPPPPASTVSEGSALAAAAAGGKRATSRHYYDMKDPAIALAALESELAAIVEPTVALVGPPGQRVRASDADAMQLREVATEKLRDLLEREVEEHTQAQARTPRRRHSDPASELVRPTAISPVLRPPALAQDSISRQWQHLTPDEAAREDAAQIAYKRLPYHADARQVQLEAECHLRAGRHGEWAADTAPGFPKAGPVWGVSVMPPGFDEKAHPELAEVIRSQNKR